MQGKEEKGQQSKRMQQHWFEVHRQRLGEYLRVQALQQVLQALLEAQGWWRALQLAPPQQQEQQQQELHPLPLPLHPPQ